MIYFAVALTDSHLERFERIKAGHIKIGTAENVSRRMHTLRHNYGVSIECIGTMSGSLKEERRLHQQFNHHRIIREWFCRGDDLTEFITKNARPWTGQEENDLSRLSCDIDASLKQQVKADAALSGQTLSTWIEAALMSYIANHSQGAAS